MELSDYELRKLAAIEADLCKDRAFARHMKRGTDGYELQRILVWAGIIAVILIALSVVIG